MKIVCDACSAKYSIADDKVRGKAVKIKCKKCNNVIFVKGDEVAASVTDEAKDTRVFGYNDAPAGEEAIWHVVIDQEQIGPITATELKQRITDGQVDSDSYVWREGFDDWQPVSAVAEFAGVASAGQTVRSDLAAMPAVSRAADDVANDLFGSRGAATAPAAAAAVASQDDKRMRGERNENSVLFSLSSLAALTSDAPRSGAAAAAGGGASAGRAQVGGNEGSGLIDIRSMAGAYLGERAPARNTGRVGSMDDIPVFSGAAFAEPAVILPPSSRSSNNNKILYGLVAAVGLLAIAAIVLVLVVFKKDGGDTVAVATPVGAKTVPDTATAPGGAGAADPAAANPAQPDPTAANPGAAPAPDPAPVAATKADPTPSTSSSSKSDRTSSKSQDRESKTSTERDRSSSSASKASAVGVPKADSKGCSEVDCLLADKKPACCSKYNSGGSSGGSTKTSSSSSGLDENLDTAAIKSGLAKVNARAKSCSTKSSAKGKVKVRVRANGGGTVDSTSVLESPDDALGSCVAAALQKATFKATQNGATFTVPFTF